MRAISHKGSGAKFSVSVGQVGLHDILRHLVLGVRHHRQPTPDFCYQEEERMPGSDEW